MIFSRLDYASLHSLFETPGYAGYRPEVAEAPNGDGKVDVAKRYLHVALKYNPPEWVLPYLARAHFEACRVAEALDVPDAYYPRVENGTLRVLEYPPGAGSERHTDFDLFTILCWRSTPDDLKIDRSGFVEKASTSAHVGDAAFKGARQPTATELDPHLHIGEIGEIVGLGPATPHSVPARGYPQYSIVYFAMPANAARLPGHRFMNGPVPNTPGQTVAEWLKERYARSRVYK
jgi:hypothetical protein